MMHLLWTVIVGFFVGLVAKFLMPGRDGGGFFITAILGIAGAVLSSYVGQAMGWYQSGEIAGFISSVIGAMVLLLVYRMVFKKSE